jgi:hypothetical protein
MIHGTVALPLYNMKSIVWLCLESLCRQKKPGKGWELVVFEELHVTAVGESYIRNYEERLREVGCERIVYLTDEKRLPLSHKWILISKAAADTSKYFCLCAGDNYYHPWMLLDAESSIDQAEWCVMTKGYFYDFSLNKVIHYCYPVINYNKSIIHNDQPILIGAFVGLQMTALTEWVRCFDMDEKWRGVDTWFSSQMQIQSIKRKGKHNSLVCFVDGSDHFENTLCTNGLNNISTGRINFFKQVRIPFYETGKKLNEIVPVDIYESLMDITQHFDGMGKPEEEAEKRS